LLPRAYYDDIEKFLTSYRKETVGAKKEGKLDEQEADPISWSPFKLILSWALDTSNIFVWTYSILQWNCMARLVNIGSLGFHNSRAGEDHIVCCYDYTKSVQTGEKCTDKHIYANLLEPTACPFLALAVFFPLKSLHLSETEKLFQADGQTTSEKDSTCISPFVHPNVHVITCSSFMWPEMHASAEAFTWFLYVRTPLVIASHNLFPRGQKDSLNTLLIHAN
jgi:hypothetical protein